MQRFFPRETEMYYPREVLKLTKFELERIVLYYNTIIQRSIMNIDIFMFSSNEN